LAGIAFLVALPKCATDTRHLQRGRRLTRSLLVAKASRAKTRVCDAVGRSVPPPASQHGGAAGRPWHGPGEVRGPTGGAVMRNALGDNRNIRPTQS